MVSISNITIRPDLLLLLLLLTSLYSVCECVCE